MNPENKNRSSAKIKNYFTESFIKTTSEVIKFYSSIERVENYSLPESERKKGEDRPHLKRTEFSPDRKGWNYHSPKLSRSEFYSLFKLPELYQRYMQEVLLKDTNKIVPIEKLKYQKKNELFLEAINNLEEDWNFHRAYNKLFHDIHDDSLLFLDLQSFCATRHVRFFLRNAFRYLEGNYVIHLFLGEKVYIPHLQFAKESVELHYSSSEGMDLENMIADYILKERIRSTNQLIERMNKVKSFVADVGKKENEPIFIKTSMYIDQKKYFNCLKKWIKRLNKNNINFSSRDSIIKNIEYNTLSLPEDKILFRENDRLSTQNSENFQSDKNKFYNPNNKNSANIKWKKRLVRDLFRDLIQYSINSHRIEEVEQKEQRTEYEKVFKRYKDMTLHERDIGCLLVEDGEISFVLLLDRYITPPHNKKRNKCRISIAQLEYWGLIEKNQDLFKITPRSARMARWCMKLMGLNYSDGTNFANYENKRKIARSYDGLTSEGHIFSWMRLNDEQKKIVTDLLGELVFPKLSAYSRKTILSQFKKICHIFYNLRQEEDKKIIENSLTDSRFQKDLNEWLRAYETINRSVIAFPVNTIPSEIERKTRTFSIFIGTFLLDDGMYSDNEKEFERSRREITNLLNYAKTFFTLIGVPATGALAEVIIKIHTENHLEIALGRYAHKVKNEGVNLISRMDNLSELIKKSEIYSNLMKPTIELEDAAERISGSVHVLNIASNGLKSHYIQRLKYCVLDVILGAYCNAYQQFFISGLKEEQEKFKVNEKFEPPILQLFIDFSKKDYHKILKKDIIYLPKLINHDFQIDSQNIEIYDYIIDADDFLADDSLEFTDKLPQKVILKCPFLEIFYNAFNHMKKEKGNNYLKVSVKRTNRQIEFKLFNPISEELYYQPLSEDMKNSPGLQANSLFFKNIGGSFEFSLKDKAITEVRINFDNMNRILNKENSHERM